jgi:hypothetical protein
MDWGLPNLADSQKKALAAVDTETVQGLFETLQTYQ